MNKDKRLTGIEFHFLGDEGPEARIVTKVHWLNGMDVASAATSEPVNGSFIKSCLAQVLVLLAGSTIKKGIPLSAVFDYPIEESEVAECMAEFVEEFMEEIRERGI